MGDPRRVHLVHRRSIELCRFSRADYWPGDFVHDRPGGHHGVRCLGSLRLEGIRGCPTRCAKADSLDVCLFPRWPGLGGTRSGVSAMNGFPVKHLNAKESFINRSF